MKLDRTESRFKMASLIPTHRFTLSTEVVNKLNEFARNELTGSMRRSEIDGLWQRFVEANSSLFAEETKRLRNMGYTGELSTKMYRSVLYYRKPSKDGSDKHVQNEPQERREYIATPGDLLAIMDEHIEMHCFRESPMTPAAGWVDFQTQKGAELEIAQQAITGSDLLSADDALNKLKKTYKNRHFLQRRRRQQQAIIETHINNME